MAIHPFDYEFQKNFYSTPQLRRVYEETARMQRWLDFVSALACAQGEVGVIPIADAQIITANYNFASWDSKEVKTCYENTRNSTMPMLKLLRQNCGNPVKDYVHYDATNQDVVDTGEVLALKEAITIIKNDLSALCLQLVQLSKIHKVTPMMGRSHGQHALSITLGLKTVWWLKELDRHLGRLNRLQTESLYGQLGGGVGTLAAVVHAPQVKQRIMQQLGLAYELCSWHTSRDRIVEIASILAMLTETCHKIANEIYTLSRSEYLEARESKAGSGKSSTMPHKSNPVLSQRVCVCATQVRAQLPTLYGAITVITT